jgi:hypothetical protein
MAAPSWDWRMRYYWTGDYSVTYPVGYNSTIKLQKGAAFPPGYRVANGQKGGGYPASGATATGNEPIKIQPPPNGSGIVKFFSTSNITVQNPDSNKKGSFAFGLGVADVNENNFPMWPYIGCGHYLDINQLPPDTLAPGESRTVTITRFDMVDNTFMGAEPIPTWPDWEMRTAASGNMLWPAVTPLFKNLGQIELKITGFWAISFATL